MRPTGTLWWKYLLAVLAVGAVAAVVWRLVHPPLSPEERCLANLHAIADAIERYKADHNGDLPVFFVSPRYNPPPNRPDLFSADELEEMSLYPKYIKDPSVFSCPGCPNDGSGRILGRSFRVTYNYTLGFWFHPRNKLKGRKAKEVFYGEIVPNYEVRVTQCGCRHRVLALLLDGTVAERPWDYDSQFGRADLFPEVKQNYEDLRRRGLDPRQGVYPKRSGRPSWQTKPKHEGGQR